MIEDDGVRAARFALHEFVELAVIDPPHFLLVVEVPHLCFVAYEAEPLVVQREGGGAVAHIFDDDRALFVLPLIVVDGRARAKVCDTGFTPESTQKDSTASTERVSAKNGHGSLRGRRMIA